MGDHLNGTYATKNGNAHQFGDVENGTSNGGAKVLDTTPVSGPAGGNFWQRALWHGGSVYDAWLSASCAQVCTLTLTLTQIYLLITSTSVSEDHLPK